MSDHDQPTRRRSKWLRFSLRSLVLLLTVAYIWLAIVFNQCRRQRRAVEAIAIAGGGVDFVRQGQTPPPPAPQWLRSIFGEELFRTPVYVRIRGDGIDDAFLAEHLPAVGSVECLIIASDAITDKGLASLPSRAEYEVFALNCPRVTDAGMTHVAALKKVDALFLNCPLLTPDGIRQLKGLAGVRQFQSMRNEQNRDASNVQLQSGDFEFMNAPISLILDYVAERFEVSINAEAMPDDVKSKPITFSAKKIPVPELLDQLLGPEQLGFVVENAGIKITSKEAGHAGRAGFRAACETFPNAETVLVDW